MWSSWSNMVLSNCSSCPFCKSTHMHTHTCRLSNHAAAAAAAGGCKCTSPDRCCPLIQHLSWSEGGEQYYLSLLLHPVLTREGGGRDSASACTCVRVRSWSKRMSRSNSMRKIEDKKVGQRLKTLSLMQHGS